MGRKRSEVCARRSALLVHIIVVVLTCVQLAAADFETNEFDGISFVCIPAGSFLMGTTAELMLYLQKEKTWTRFQDCEMPAHSVTLSKPFLIGKFEVTQKQWQAIMGKNPSAVKDENRPVDSVSWNDAQEFIKKLSEKSGAKYRLPTEAEWEYCCRAGSTNSFGLGRGGVEVTRENLGEFASYRDNADNGSHLVGGKSPNAWGLYDFHGNLWEWCQDWYAADFYKTSPAIDPVNREATIERVLRGGSWFLDWTHLRSAFRSGNLPTFKSQYAGFRLVREIDPEKEE